MLKKTTLLAALAVLLALPVLAEESAVKKLGAPVGDAKPTPIATIAKDPSAFDNKEVTVEGKVCGVCTVAGCWMELEQDQARVKIKVDDGKLVFPADSVGLHAKARGKVTLTELSRSQYIAFKHHEADETGQKFDEKSVGDGPYKVVQIEGLGAEIGN